MKKIIATLIMGLLLAFTVTAVSASQDSMRQTNMSGKKMMMKKRHHRKMMRKHHRHHRRMMMKKNM